LTRQEQAWECYFEVHGIDALRIEYETLAEDPQETVRGILEWLELPGSPAGKWNGRLPRLHPQEPVEWLPDYQAERDRLPAAIGVRKERS